MKKILSILALCIITAANASHSMHRIADAHKKNPKTFSKYNSALIRGSNLRGTFGQFYKSKDLPFDVEVTLDAHARELKEFLNSRDPEARMGINVRKEEWLPGFLIKYGICRVKNAEKIKTIAKEHNLDLITVPEKYLYHIPGTPDALADENYVVIAKEVPWNPEPKKLTLKHAKQLCTVALHAPHYDLHGKNYILQKDGKLAIIDTDSYAMPCQEDRKKIEEEWILHGTRIHDKDGMPAKITHPIKVLERSSQSKQSRFDSEAYKYIWEQAQRCEEERQQIRRKKLLKKIMRATTTGFCIGALGAIGIAAIQKYFA